MNRSIDRRNFLASTAAGLGAAGFADLGFFRSLPLLRAADTKVEPRIVQLDAGIEPVVRWLESTPRDRLMEEAGARLRAGLSYRELLAALFLAGVRNIQPRPYVGFKFHAVLVVHSCHLASLSSPPADRWLPVFWALDDFKRSQQRDVEEGNWTMAPVDESRVPTADKAEQAFLDAIATWDVAAADAAAAGLARSVGLGRAFDLFARVGLRDYRSIGHKIIYVANGFRTLHTIGVEHAEPVFRSLAYALLQHEGKNPAGRDGAPDRPGRANSKRLHELKSDWLQGRRDADATIEFRKVLRDGEADEASRQAVALVR